MMEEIVENAVTGGRKGTKAERFDLIPVEPLRELARHYHAGSLKYADRNWEKGVDWSLSYAALMRHLTAWWGGEDYDDETGSTHLAAVAWHAFALMEYAETHPELDDRPEPTEYASANYLAARYPEVREWEQEADDTIVGETHAEWSNRFYSDDEWIVETGRKVFRPTPTKMEGTSNA